MSFKDYFSGVSTAYSSYRPGYPDELFDYLAGLTPATGLAWDCATGSGQAAVELAKRFDAVIATDGSQSQLDTARRATNIEYRQEVAEDCSVEDGKADLVTVGQALHWFDLPAFEEQASRVLKPNGILAVWSYAILESTPAIDAVIHRLYEDILGDYWTSERRIVEQGYSSVDFGFEELEPPAFAMQANWNLAQMLGYLSTWSAGKRYEEATGGNALELVADEMAEAWGQPDKAVLVAWPLTVRVWRKR